VLRIASLAALLSSRLATAAAPSAATRRHIDADAFRNALQEEIDRWRDAAELPNGFIQPAIDRQWRPTGQQIGTLTIQARHMYMRARGYDVTRDPAYLQSLHRIADFTLASFRDTQLGGFYLSVSPDGKVVDEHKDSYATAFAIFGLSHAARVTRDERYREAALQTWAYMKKSFRDPTGFYKLRLTRDLSEQSGTLSQNPIMHLFEALLALYDATRSREILVEAESLGHSLFTRLFQGVGGYMPEFYDAEWKPLREEPRGYIDLGNQFEWAYWWSRAVEKGFPQSDLRMYGQRVLNFGVKAAYDAENGGIFSILDRSESLVKAPKGLWQQCEFLRALMNWAVLHGRSDLWDAFDKTLAMFREHFQDASHGGYFRPYYDPKSPPTEAQLFKNANDTYHVCGMYSEGLRLSGALNEYGS
jgi:mannose/cellobiose epimerase-like protein (N-acyl-D-glucosamine 2-epimerase family)